MTDLPDPMEDEMTDDLRVWVIERRAMPSEPWRFFDACGGAASADSFVLWQRKLSPSAEFRVTTYVREAK